MCTPGAVPAWRHLTVDARWRAPAGHSARETMLYRVAVLRVRVGRTLPRMAHSTIEDRFLTTSTSGSSIL
eukprot:4579477-Pyramimonas_sp.AAC.1